MIKTLKILKTKKKAAKNNAPLTKKSQVILEFTFCMIIVLLMLFGLTKVFTWVGRDYAGRSAAHDSTLTMGVVESYGGCLTYVNFVCTQWSTMADGPMKQVDPYFYTPVKMNAIYAGK
jgi:hypothetical protein